MLYGQSLNRIIVLFFKDVRHFKSVIFKAFGIWKNYNPVRELSYGPEIFSRKKKIFEAFKNHKHSGFVDHVAMQNIRSSDQITKTNVENKILSPERFETITFVRLFIF